VLATGNPDKVAEWKELLAPLGIAVVTPELPEAREDGGSCAANALLKARSAVAATQLPALADDVGLEVDALGGRPGAELKPWAMSAGGWTEARRVMAATAGGSRATYRCALALAFVAPRRDPIVTEGTLRGVIGPPAGDGRGLEPCFYPEGFTRSLAQLGADDRARIHHRAKAWELLLRADPAG
jgi:XTP/dITP diphosphohydrolase